LSYEVSRPDHERFNRNKSEYILGDLTYLKGDEMLRDGALGKIETIPKSVKTSAEEKWAMDIEEKLTAPEIQRGTENFMYGVRALCWDRVLNVPQAKLIRLHPSAEQEYQAVLVGDETEEIEVSEPKYFFSLLEILRRTMQ